MSSQSGSILATSSNRKCFYVFVRNVYSTVFMKAKSYFFFNSELDKAFHLCIKHRAF